MGHPYENLSPNQISMLERAVKEKLSRLAFYSADATLLVLTQVIRDNPLRNMCYSL